MIGLIKRLLKRKVLLMVIILVIIGGGYYFYNKIKGSGSAVHYVTAAVQKGTLIVSVSGSGQVSASNQIDMKPKVSGDVSYINVNEGQEVKAGTLILQLDTTDAAKAVRDAQVSLDSAKLALAKLQEPADTLTLLQDQNALAQATDTKNQAEDDLKKSYDDGFNTVANAFLDLPTVISGLHDILYTSTLSNNVSGQTNINYYADAVKNYDDRVLQYRDDADAKYQKARQEYDKNIQDYKSASRFSGATSTVTLINETYNTTKDIAEAVKSANNLIQFYVDRLTERNLTPATVANTHLASLNTYTGKTNTDLGNLFTVKQTIQNDQTAIDNANRTIAEKTEIINKLQSGPDPLDIQTQELAVKQKENALLDAQETLADYYLRAPFDGVVAKLDVKVGDPASSATLVDSFITRQKLAQISLNEVDAAKVKVGDKATLTFDAIPNLSISGEASEIDTIGTVTQGVVTYNVKIGFDTQDARVKSGMSVNADVITDVKQDTLVIPNSAVKQQGGISYVEVMVGTTPQQRPVQTGLANDTETEITSGVQEGDLVVTQTITGAAPQTSAPAGTGGIRIPGLGGGGGGGGGGIRRIGD